MLTEKPDDIIQTCKKWVETFIIDLNLCPFAKQFYIKNKVRFVVIDKQKSDDFFYAFGDEVECLQQNETPETTLMIIPAFGNIQHFMMYFKLCQEMLEINKADKDFMIVPFHPAMRNHQHEANDPQQFTGIAPYPIVHILRQKTVNRLGAKYKSDIQKDNDATLRKMGTKKLMQLLKDVLQ